MRRPKPIEFEELVCRPVRQPSKREPEWYWRATRRGGKRRTLWTGRGSRAEVRAILLSMLAEGLPERDDRQPEDNHCETVGDLLEFYVGHRDDRTDLRPHSKRAVRNSGKRLKKTVGAVAVDRISTVTMEEHRDRALASGYSTGTVKEDWNTLQAAVSWGQTRGLVDGAIVVRRPKMTHRPAREVYVPERDEVESVIAALGNWRRIVTLLLAETGARRDEIVTLLWDDVDFGGGWITIRATKTAKTRRVPLPARVTNELRKWRLRTPGPRIVTCHDQTARSALYRSLQKTCKRLELPMISPQSLRRYRERELSRAGVGVEVFAQLLGHSPAVALAHYLRATDDDLRAAVDLVGRNAHTSARTQEG